MSFTVATNFPLINAPWEISQPFNIDQYGEVAYTQDQRVSIESHIISLLLTSPGERVMRTSYGVGLFNYVFENDDPMALANIQALINQQIGLYEPGVNVTSVSVEPDGLTVGQVNVKVEYTILATQQSYKSIVTLGGQVVELR